MQHHVVFRYRDRRKSSLFARWKQEREFRSRNESILASRGFSLRFRGRTDPSVDSETMNLAVFATKPGIRQSPYHYCTGGPFSTYSWCSFRALRRWSHPAPRLVHGRNTVSKARRDEQGIEIIDASLLFSFADRSRQAFSFPSFAHGFVEFFRGTMKIARATLPQRVCELPFVALGFLIASRFVRSLKTVLFTADDSF
jgi:hypothetical protein